MLCQKTLKAYAGRLQHKAKPCNHLPRRTAKEDANEIKNGEDLEEVGGDDDDYQEDLKFKPTCPDGHPGCSPHNVCKVCPAECQTCQNIRYAIGHHGECETSDCFSCEAGYNHVQKHGDGRGQCMSAGAEKGGQSESKNTRASEL